MSKIQGISHQLGTKACACNSSTWEAEAGRASPVWGLSELHRDQNKYAGVHYMEEDGVCTEDCTASSVIS